MRKTRVLVVELGLLLIGLILDGCSGSGSFIPDPNLFQGEFRVEGEIVGTFSFTSTTTGLQGLGLMTINGTTQVAIAAVVDDRAIEGSMTGHTGTSAIVGSFSNEVSATGLFNFTDPEGDIIEGTWTAQISD